MSETSNVQSLTIPERFRGPPASGNGGYVSGALAPFATLSSGQSPEITLRAPIPLDQPLTIAPAAGEPSTQHAQVGTTLIAEIKGTQLVCEVPAPPTWAETEAAASESAALKPNLNPLLPGRLGFHPICFCCGPEHAEGLKVFVAPVGRQVSGLWQTQEAWATSDGSLPEAFLWTALDCPGQYAFFAEGIRTGLLGRMTAEILTRPKAGTTLQVTAWTISVNGKKHLAGGALFDSDRNLLAYAHTLWIGRQPMQIKP
ncbi:MAG: hypothetical protein ISP92_00725 [Pseudomonadales bacterium]|nr:hypothetical protein [Pseudomonadales bacterium]